MMKQGVALKIDVIKFFSKQVHHSEEILRKTQNVYKKSKVRVDSSGQQFPCKSYSVLIWAMRL